jgi:hypothetical protein
MKHTGALGRTEEPRLTSMKGIPPWKRPRLWQRLQHMVKTRLGRTPCNITLENLDIMQCCAGQEGQGSGPPPEEDHSMAGTGLPESACNADDVLRPWTCTLLACSTVVQGHRWHQPSLSDPRKRCGLIAPSLRPTQLFWESSSGWIASRREEMRRTA